MIWKVRRCSPGWVIQYLRFFRWEYIKVDDPVLGTQIFGFAGLDDVEAFLDESRRSELVQFVIYDNKDINEKNDEGNE